MASQNWYFDDIYVESIIGINSMKKNDIRICAKANRIITLSKCIREFKQKDREYIDIFITKSKEINKFT